GKGCVARGGVRTVAAAIHDQPAVRFRSPPGQEARVRVVSSVGREIRWVWISELPAHDAVDGRAVAHDAPALLRSPETLPPDRHGRLVGRRQPRRYARPLPLALPALRR